MTRDALVWILLAAAACAPAADRDPVDTDEDGPPSEIPPYVAGDEVDPFIGTADGRFQNLNCFPGAVLPFGLVSLSPDTAGGEDTPSRNHAAGYLTGDPWILGFSHTRLQGTSTPDLGAVLVTASTADAATLIRPEGYRSRYTDESARPGSYAVTLTDPGVRAEVSVSRRAGHHRYRFPEGASVPKVVVAVGHGLPGVTVLVQELRWDADTARLEGSVVHAGRFSSQAPGGHTTWFSATFDPAPAEVRLWQDGVLDAGTDLQGFDLGAVLAFPDAAEVQVRVGISYVDLEGARRNRTQELAEDFERTRDRAAQAWEDELAHVRVRGGTEAHRRTFLTALYHSLVVPSTMTDVDGRFRAFDGEVKTAGFEALSNFSLWDTYRTTAPLHMLAYPERAADVARSLVEAGRDAGLLPRWTLSWASTNDTVGASADIVLAESHARGIGGFDPDEALDLMQRAVDGPPAPGDRSPGREGITDYVRLGWVPVDGDVRNGSPRTVTRTLEYAIADGAMAGLATALGRTAEATAASVRARSYGNLWDEGTHTFRGRYADGSWYAPFDANTGDSALYYGGSALQYAWMVPHDMDGLVGLHGSPEAFVERLEAFFLATRAALAATPPGEPVTTGGYWHGNEPDIHAPWLFLAAGRPDLTQAWVHEVSEAFYNDTRNGYAGNEDAGALSAWFVLASLGIYPQPGTDRWLVGRPLFELAEVRTSRGLLVIRAEGAGELPYVHGLTLNGEAVTEPWLRHGDLMGSAELVFTMGAEPGDWGR